MTFLTRAATLAALLFFPHLVFGQGAIQQSGPVVAGHPPVWLRNGIQGDGGPPGCVYTAMPTSGQPYSSLCDTISPTGGATVMLQSNPNNAPLPLNIITDGGPISFTIGGVKYTFPFPSAPIDVPFLAAASFGVVADGVTSNDAALANALAACTAAGSSLWLPPGKILLTGTQSLQLRNCGIIGSGAPATFALGNPGGTTILLTSTTTPPFIAGNSWSITGVNFYWPNQINGATVYPPLISDNGLQGVAHAFLDHVAIINAYDGIVETNGLGWGDVVFSNSTMFAAHNMFKFSNTGDSFAFSNMRFTPGAWENICGTACDAGIYAAFQNNVLFHIGAGPGVTVAISSSETFGWRYGFLIDSGGIVGNSIIDVAWDGTGTLIDASSGGQYAIQNTWRGSGGCGIPPWGAFPAIPGTTCFNMGGASGLALNGYLSSSTGTFISIGGGTLFLRNSDIETVGTAANGSDYYLVNMTGPTELIIQNNNFGGHGADIHAHGIATGANTPVRLIVQDNAFLNFNDDIMARTSAGTNQITGNWSAGTTGTASIALTGTDGVSYTRNLFDKPPQATVSACGAGASISGSFTGFVGVGSTNPTTSCTVTLPFTPTGPGAGTCNFTPSIAIALGAAVSGTPPQWGMSASSDMHSAQIWFNCPGSL